MYLIDMLIHPQLGRWRQVRFRVPWRPCATVCTKSRQRERCALPMKNGIFQEKYGGFNGKLMGKNRNISSDHNWLVVTGTMDFYDFPFSWEFHDPN